MKRRLSILVMLVGTAFGSTPSILYLSAKAGPNHGWAQDNAAYNPASPINRGAAITIWGRNFGASRGSNYVTVAGANLTTANDYAEWGATTNPQTAKGFQRITFWLNSSMATGATTVSVTVGGVTSNTLPFTIDNTAASDIRFVDNVNGNETYDGQYPDHALGGSHGPWLYVSPGNNTPHSGWGVAGAFLYMRGVTYSSICLSGSGYHCPTGGVLGHPTDIAPITWYNGPFNGTDALRITLTSYPGENAHWLDVGIWQASSYWTLTNFTVDGDIPGSTGIYIAIEVGNPAEYCNGETFQSFGNQLIGLSFIGYIHNPFQLWGNSINAVANYMANYPTDSGMGAFHSYNFYMGSVNGVVMKDNEMHNGAEFKGQMYDEARPSCSAGNDRRYIRNVLFDSNWMDMNASPVVPQTFNGAVILGMGGMNGSPVTPDITNVTLSNNVVEHTDSNTVIDGLSFHQDSAPLTLNGVYFYNNTIYNVGTACFSERFGATTATGGTTVQIKNNICYATPMHWYSEFAGATQIFPTWDYNLTNIALNVTPGILTVGAHGVVGNPGFISTSTPDFHLSSAGSPANGAGVTISGITLDYDGLIRPSPPSIGAYEFAAGVSVQPPTNLKATVQ